jgi:hypothetical protein
MTSKLQQVGKLAVPALLVAMMAGCATTKDVENLQNQINEVRASASNANATASSAVATASDAKTIASEARSTANAAMAAATEASGFASAAMKGSEMAAGAAAQAQKTVGEATVAIPWMRLDPATGRFVVQWIIWPSVGDYVGAAPVAAAPAPAAEAPAANGPKP